MVSVPEEINSSSDVHLPFSAMLPRSAWPICSKSPRTPVRLIACVGAVPASLTGILRRKKTYAPTETAAATSNRARARIPALWLCLRGFRKQFPSQVVFADTPPGRMVCAIQNFSFWIAAHLTIGPLFQYSAGTREEIVDPPGQTEIQQSPWLKEQAPCGF